MKFAGLILFLLIASIGFSQEQEQPKGQIQKGSFYVYWGWNLDWYSKSDLHFQGQDYDFTLEDVIANDRQSKFNLNPYFNPILLTIPQYNFRAGFFISKNYDVSFGMDHMKYIMQANQTVKISGNIKNTGTAYDGAYNNDDIVLANDFLQFEHSDGLNYVNFELRRSDRILDLNNIKINLTEGLGLGVLYPKTNSVVFGKERYDEFQLTGYGIGGVVGINISICKNFFIQSEFKGGFIDMPRVRTTALSADRANHNFFFSQLNIVFGSRLNFQKKKSTDTK
jgi:hypothetical protein